MHLKIALLFSLVFVTLIVSGHDRTKERYAKGKSIVDAALEKLGKKCVFPDDKLFLRRIAKGISDDGVKLSTSGSCTGGIWGLSESKFAMTKAASLSKYTTLLEKEFNVKWSDLKYEDLCTPFYGAIAAQLYVTDLVKNRKKTIPWNQEDQYTFLTSDYFESSETTKINALPAVATFTSEAQSILNTECGAAKIDIVMVVDQSGSVGKENFKELLKSIQKIVDKFEISRDATRVAFVKYSSDAKLIWGFTAFENKAKLIERIGNVGYEGGSTNTAAGIDRAVQVVDNQGRSRKDAANHIIIVFTDGKSNDEKATKAAAKRAHDKGINMFSVGIGSNLNTDELRAMASTPVCEHFFQLENFNNVLSFIDKLQQQSCKAGVIAFVGEVVQGTLAPGGQQVFDFVVEEKTPINFIEVEVEAGGIYMCTSTITSTPNEDVNDACGHVGEGASLVVPVDLEVKVEVNLKRRKRATSESKQHVYVSIKASSNENNIFRLRGGSNVVKISLLTIALGLLISLFQI